MKKKQPKQAFTLIELLTVIAIIGILASILIPTVGKVREQARRTVDGNNIRQIGQGSLIYANDNRERLPPTNLSPTTGLPSGATTARTTTVKAYAGALAQSGGINDGHIWISSSDRDTRSRNYDGSPILTPSGTGGERTIRTGPNAFGAPSLGALSFGVIAGLGMGDSSRTPIAFTRGLQSDGYWSNTGEESVYGNTGGHIVYIGGNVSWYRDTRGDNNTGIFININQANQPPTTNLQDTVDTDTKMILTLPTGVGVAGG